MSRNRHPSMPLATSLATTLVAALSGCADAADDSAPGGSPAGTGAVGPAWAAAGGVPGIGGAVTAGAGSGGPSAGSGGVIPGSGGVAAAGGAPPSGGTGGVVVNPACPGNAANAYLGTPGSVPGTIEAEDFDDGGYFDSTPGNEGGAYRTDVDVDIKPLGAGYAIGWCTAGEWLEYTVNVPAEGDYRIVLRVGAVEPGRTLELSQCGASLTGPIAVPQIAAWGEIATTTTGPVHLSAGLQVIRVTVGANDYVDFDSMTFEEDTGGTGGTAGSGAAAGSGGTAGSGAAAGSGGSGGSAGSGGSGGTGGTPSVRGFVGNITTSYSHSVDYDGMTFADHWDQITPENAGKWGSVLPSAGAAYNWSTLEAIYSYAEQHGILFKQHTFVWGSQQPSGTLTEADVKYWMQEFCQRFPNTALIDVVNEPPPHTTPSYADAIGGGTNGDWAWIVNSFEWADEYCPDAVLILNDYNNIEWSGDAASFISIANAVKAAGAPIDAVGAQAHSLDSQNWDTVKTLLANLHDETGLPVYITEYDPSSTDDAQQLAWYQEQVPYLRSLDYVHGITIWGWIYGETWDQAEHSGLVRNGNPRPAMTWLMNELGRPVP